MKEPADVANAVWAFVALEKPVGEESI